LYVEECFVVFWLGFVGFLDGFPVYVAGHVEAAGEVVCGFVVGHPLLEGFLVFWADRFEHTLDFCGSFFRHVCGYFLALQALFGGHVEGGLAFRVAHNRFMRLKYVAFEVGGEPVVSAGCSVLEAHALLDYCPSGLLGYENRVVVEGVTCLDGCVVDFGCDSAGVS